MMWRDDFELPDWFEHIATEARAFCQPHRHFGQCWGEVFGNTVRLTANAAGLYHVLLTAHRKDAGVANWELERIKPAEKPEIEEPA